MQLREFVRLIRGETSEDPRPNKGLEVPSHAEGWISYKYRHLLEDIVMHGVRPRWNSQFRQECTPPRYHASATSCLNVLVEQIRKGLDSDKYLVLDIDLLAELEGIICSPFGAVEKSSPDTSHQARAIHGLSYPELASVNDNTAADDSVIVTFDGPQALARRILEVEVEFPDDAMMMSGDVHFGDRSVLSIWLASLAAALLDGWSSNYAPYAASAPTWPLQPSEAATPFDPTTWCDDHNLIEPDIGTRLGEANLALRGAIVSIRGPEAIHEEKFTPWFKLDKVTKALGLNVLLESTVNSRSQVYKLLERLRHVVTCVRSGTQFFQRFAVLTYSTRRLVQIFITDAVRDDLNWFQIILGAADLNSIPLSRFTNSQRVDFDIYMDASNYGLCALFPARREMLEVLFDEMELQSIEETLTLPSERSFARYAGITRTTWGMIPELTPATPSYYVEFAGLLNESPSTIPCRSTS
ncbi:hypothetical protein L914_12961 [Phytophthora nicotianae]|uniref:Uncharacterized protein n=1 Tax=Phytophthora nicotianae TaxID=4792 RepID=W2MY33_PHYNI|nr:hypothetical protein L914_12961 [Phytophthora nicotianae]